MITFLRHQGFKFYDWATGHNVLQCLDELSQTQWLSPDELRALQIHRLQSLLEHAYTYVPYYRRVFDEVGFRPGNLVQDPESFHKIPPISKTYIRSHPEEFFTTDAARRKKLWSNSTSGSTGEPFVFWSSREAMSYSLANGLRHHTWCGWRVGQPRAYLWGRRIKRKFSGKLAEKARDFAWNSFTIDAYTLSEEAMNNLVYLIRRRKPQLLQGYPSALYLFAQFVRENKLDDIKLPAIYSSAEVLYPHQRKYIEETFEGSVFNRYAAQEVGGIACQCEQHTDMHLSMETNYVEILDGNVPVKDDEVGTIVVTKLINYDYPLIRYRLEDVGRLSTQQCSCGRGQSMLEVVEGRHNDMFKTRDGRLVWGGMGNPLWNMAGVKKFQFIQKTYDYVVVRIVKEGPMSQAQRAEVEKAVKFVLGEQVKLDFELPDEIPVDRSGKHRYQICELDQQFYVEEKQHA